jgi:hypothetical protein
MPPKSPMGASGDQVAPLSSEMAERMG